MPEEFGEKMGSLRDEFNGMLKAAGVSDADLERAWEGRFIPYGVYGEGDDLPRKENNKLYFDDEHDDNRKRIRQLAFGIADVKQRKAIIEKRHEWESAYCGELTANETQAHRALAELRAQGSGGWGSAAVTGGLLVALGYWAVGMVGAIAGAVVGYFLGHKFVADHRHALDRQIQAAEAEVADCLENTEDEHVQPKFFSRMERVSGEEDEDFGHESAFENRMKKIHRNQQAT